MFRFNQMFLKRFYDNKVYAFPNSLNIELILAPGC